MRLNRRGFVAALMGAALDPDRLLWQPGRKFVSIPKPRVEIRVIVENQDAFYGMLTANRVLGIRPLRFPCPEVILRGVSARGVWAP